MTFELESFKRLRFGGERRRPGGGGDVMTEVREGEPNGVGRLSVVR